MINNQWKLMRNFFTILTLLFFFTATKAIAAHHTNIHIEVGKASLIKLKDIKTLFIGNPNIASYQTDATGEGIILYGKMPGQTSIYVMNDNGEIIYEADINVDKNVSALRQAIGSQFPGINITITPIGNSIILSGVVPNAITASEIVTIANSFYGAEKVNVSVDQPETQSSGGSQSDTTNGSGVGNGTGSQAGKNGNVINRLTILNSNQVMINIRIAEVSRTIGNQLGFHWTGGTGAVRGVASPLIFSPAIGQKNPTALIDALASEDVISILAEPTLTVLSGETASFLAGGQVPLPVLQDRNVGVQLHDYGVLLGVTATILSPDRINLHVRPEVSQVDPQTGVTIDGQSIPGFSVRKADTTIELASGQSFMLGGLLQHNLQNQEKSIPYLSKIPIIGSLFKSEDFKNSKTELVIIATVYLVDPISKDGNIPNEYIYIPSEAAKLFISDKIRFSPNSNVRSANKFIL